MQLANQYNFNLNGCAHAWNSTQIEEKLRHLSRLNKETAWLTAELDTTPSTMMGRIIWTFVAKYVLCLREYLYGVNLQKSQEILNQLKPQIGDNRELQGLFNRAVCRFNQVAPRHTVAEVIVSPPAEPEAPQAFIPIREASPLPQPAAREPSPPAQPPAPPPVRGPSPLLRVAPEAPFIPAAPLSSPFAQSASSAFQGRTPRPLMGLPSTIVVEPRVAAEPANSTQLLPQLSEADAFLQSQLGSLDRALVDPIVPPVVAVVVEEPAARAIPVMSTRELIERFDAGWNDSIKNYENISLGTDIYRAQFEAHNAMFAPQFDPVTEHGYVEKRTVPAGTRIFVRADLHGDLKSLMENLKTAQRQGLLDENFKCTGPDVQMVFLGDYSDRGQFSMQVFLLLLALRMENPEQVTLIRGNHEDLNINVTYGRNDVDFWGFIISGTANQDLVDNFYQRLPLSIFFGTLRADGGEIEHVVFTHAAFEIYADHPFAMLNSQLPAGCIAIPKRRLLSERVIQLAGAERPSTPAAEGDRGVRRLQKRVEAAQRISTLFQQERAIRPGASGEAGTQYTTYNWGDIATQDKVEAQRWGYQSTIREGDISILAEEGNRHWMIAPADVKHYFRLLGRVKYMFRGHEHVQQHHSLPSGKALISTMPVGRDCPGYNARLPQEQTDTAYILTAAPKVRDWTKQGYFRRYQQNDVEITEPRPIRDISI